MRSQGFAKRLRKAEQMARVAHKYSEDCICFPPNESPTFAFPICQEMAVALHCPLHGPRLRNGGHIYCSKWMRDKIYRLLWTHRSEQFRKAWFATFPPELWPAVEEETDDGQIFLRLKNGERLLAFVRTWRGGSASAH